MSKLFCPLHYFIKIIHRCLNNITLISIRIQFKGHMVDAPRSCKNWTNARCLSILHFSVVLYRRTPEEYQFP